MIMTTTNAVEGRRVDDYLGIVMGEAIIGANIIKDLFAAVRDVVGGRAGAYEEALRSARQEALREMATRAQELGANAVIGVDIDYEVLGKAGSMLMVTSAGTAVRITDPEV
jgi:uncharacterized protein YbjQ (UPF0145 family)